MIMIDYLILVGFLVGMLVIGGIFSLRIKDSQDMFNAGGSSPWWVSGLSGFMTMFSAGTFVVWGGIAYKHGLVAVSINMCYGVAAIFVAFFIAGRWQRLGISNVSEFIAKRFGYRTVNLYTWIYGAVNIFGQGATLYAFARIFCALIPMTDGSFLADPESGNLSVTYTTIIIGMVVIIYTMAGGLWAVLMTDVLQFVILLVSILIVVPLSISKVGGITEFVSSAPKDFFKPVSGDYTWLFIFGWIFIHIFKVGGEWQFAQRYICVPTKKDAVKSALLFAFLYLVSPILWMLPPMLYRTINPEANSEEAYILMCKDVLPAGMMGMMMAAMLSATASMVSSILNVFAGVVTKDFYKRIFKPNCSVKHEVWAGRVITLVLGLVMIYGGIIIPRWGITRFIIMLASLLTGPLVLPIIWGLFSRKISEKAVWITLSVNAIALAVKVALTSEFASRIGFLDPLINAIADNPKISDIFIGTVIPFLSLLVMELTWKDVTQPGWKMVMERPLIKKDQVANVTVSNLPALIVAWALIILGSMILLVGLFNKTDNLIPIIFGIIVYFISISIFVYVKLTAKNEIESKELINV